MKLTKNAQDSPQKYIQVKWILFSVPGTLWVDEDIEKVWKYGKSSAGHLKKPPTYLSQSIFLESHCFRHLFESLSLRQSQAWNFKNVATFLAFTQPRTRNRKKWRSEIYPEFRLRSFNFRNLFQDQRDLILFRSFFYNPDLWTRQVRLSVDLF